MNKIINLDYAGNYPKNEQMLTTFVHVSKNCFNSHSSHKLGEKWKEYLDICEKNIIDNFNKYNTVDFVCGGGTLASKKSILNMLPLNPINNKDTVIISSIEHSSIYTIIKNELIRRKYNVQIANVNSNGIIDIINLIKFIWENVKKICLISIMYVNNETGMIQPIFELSKIIKKFDNQIIFHSDITQGICLYQEKLINETFFPDIVWFSCYKIGGPHMGIILSLNIKEVYDDYSGTKDIPWIFAWVYLIGIKIKWWLKDNKNCKKIKEKIKEKIKIKLHEINEKIKEININDSESKKKTNNEYVKCLDISPFELSVNNIQSFLIYDEKYSFTSNKIQSLLNDSNICVWTGAACSGDLSGSHVIKNMGYKNLGRNLLR